MALHNTSGGSGPASFTAGDLKHGVQTADHAGWYLVDGRAVASLPSAAQANAIALGFAANLPNATGAVLKSKAGVEVIGANIGSNSQTIGMANLPAATLNSNITGAHAHGTDAQGAHTHTIPRTLFTGALAVGALGSSPGPLITSSSAGSHTHTSDSQGDHSHTVSLPGGGAPMDVRQLSLVVNTFIYLG